MNKLRTTNNHMHYFAGCEINIILSASSRTTGKNSSMPLTLLPYVRQGQHSEQGLHITFTDNSILLFKLVSLN